MSHLSPERLASLTDDTPTPIEAAHITMCDACTDELAAHRRLARMAVESRADFVAPISNFATLAPRLRAEGIIEAVDRRAVIRHWATRVTISFAQPIIKLQSVANLLASGGITSGIGDWRVEKGSGSYGTFRVCAQDDPEYLRIIAEGGREAQDEALQNPTAFDDETETLLSWYGVEARRRGFAVAS